MNDINKNDNPEMYHHLLDTLLHMLFLQEKYDAVEKILRPLLDESEVVNGLTHELTLQYLHNLALVLAAQNKLDAAEKLLRQAVNGWEKLYGRQDIVSLHLAHNLADLLMKQNKLA